MASAVGPDGNLKLGGSRLAAVSSPSTTIVDATMPTLSLAMIASRGPKPPIVPRVWRVFANTSNRKA